MSQNKNNDPEEKTGIEGLNDSLTNAGRKLVEQKKVVFWIVGIAAVAAVFILAYLFIYRNPRINKSFEEYNAVEVKAAQNDSLAIAMLRKVADEYEGMGGGNLAALDAGERLYEQGKYKDALDCLEMFDTDEPVIRASSYVLMGDCCVQLKKYDDALSYFDKAMKADKENPQIAPRVLLKKANIFDAQKKYADALACYEEIRDNYPAFNPGIGIDAYISREQERLGK